MHNIVNIESLDKNNRSFGTGFVIDSDDRGVYILTCQHVLDDVKTPMVQEVKARVVARGEEIDMAVLYVSKLQLSPLPLQINSCKSLEVEVMGFSSFNQDMTQKKHIFAMLYEKKIELHDNKSDFFYYIRKIQANKGYTFDRGNSGSPVFCKKTKKVIAMISNKEGNEIGYAIEINSLEVIWKDMPSYLFDHKYNKIEEVSGERPYPKRKQFIKQEKHNFNKIRNIILVSMLFLLLIGGYTFFNIDRVSSQEMLNIIPNPTFSANKNLQNDNGTHEINNISESSYSNIETCININPATLKIKQENSKFHVLANNKKLFSFRHDKGAMRTIFIIQSYNMTTYCFIGQHERVFQYMLSNDEAPLGNIIDEECMGFRSENLKLKSHNNHYEILSDDYKLFKFAYKKEAESSFHILQKYKFRHLCYIRNPQSDFQYFKK